MALFAAGVALTALLFATYTSRHSWLACGSAVLSVVALIGVVFLATAKDSQSQEHYVWLANQLEPVVDRQTLDRVTTAIAQVSTALVERARQRAAEAPEPQTVQAASSSSWLGAEPAPKPAPMAEPAKVMPAPDAMPPPKAVPALKASAGDPVHWLLDAAGDPPPVLPGDGFRIGGVNVSDQALTEVRGILKPDRTRRRLALTLDVEGGAAGGPAVVPPGAKFTLAHKDQASDGAAADGVDQSGGAILTFRYSLGGQRKSKIVYLTAPMLARLAESAGGTP
jgi:hypothetical protein